MLSIRIWRCPWDAALIYYARSGKSQLLCLYLNWIFFNSEFWKCRKSWNVCFYCHKSLVIKIEIWIFVINSKSKFWDPFHPIPFHPYNSSQLKLERTVDGFPSRYIRYVYQFQLLSARCLWLRIGLVDFWEKSGLVQDLFGWLFKLLMFLIRKD